MLEKEIKVKSLPLDIKKDANYIIDQSNPNSFTHGFFKYPCKFIPEIPRWAIAKYTENIKNPIIYDPFSGSGTTLLEAAIKGYQSYGSEIDDTAKLITRAKTTKFSEKQLASLDSFLENLLKYINKKDVLSLIPKIINIEHWFSLDTIQHLGNLKYAITQIEDNTIRDFFDVCFVSIIKKVSFADNISPKPYVSSKIKKEPSSVEKEFRSIYKRYKEGVVSLSKVRKLPSPCILKGGALALDKIEYFHLAVTSPPYINAFDYARSMRLENLWLGYATEESIRASKRNYIGTESMKLKKNFNENDFLSDSNILQLYLKRILEVDVRRAMIVNKFFTDMKRNMDLVYKSLKPKGVYVVVIGNSTIRKVHIESWRVLEEIATNIGYKHLTHFSYDIRNPYIRIPRVGQGGIINSDHIIVFSK